MNFSVVSFGWFRYPRARLSPNVKLTRHPNREEEMIVENVNLSIRDRTT